jgi:predicted metalloprotease with PDZ domain
MTLMLPKYRKINGNISPVGRNVRPLADLRKFVFACRAISLLFARRNKSHQLMSRSDDARAALRTCIPASALLVAALAGSPPHCVAAADTLPDRPYIGPLSVDVDLRQAPRKIFSVHEEIPVKPGALTLLYPKWIPGEHSPSGTLDSVTGLKITANGRPLPWRRDLVDMFAINLDLPSGVSRIAVDFQFLSPAGGGSFGESTSATPSLAEIEWNQVAFYPAGYPARQITIAPSIRVPDGWQFATALERNSDIGGVTHFAAVSFEQLVDSPLFTGQYVKRIDLAPSAAVPVHLNVFADRAANLDLKQSQIDQHIALVKQAVALFASQHYGHYDFLLAVSDHTGSFGLEHHQSSDDRTFADLFTDPDLYSIGVGLMPHEYVHSWNGKFRRPAGLATPDYSKPMQGDLLWVYEGLTVYLGNLLTARAGLWTAEQYRDVLAITASQMDHVPGRDWRSLQDTADAAQRLYFVPRAWSSERRLTDYYPEGGLIWLDVDTTIRELSGNTRSLDDFVRAFYGLQNGSMKVLPYRFEDIVAALQAVQPNDWRGFLRQRLDTHEVRAPLGGIQRGGWKLTYTDTPSAIYKAYEKARKTMDRSDSLGISVSIEDKGEITNVIWGSPAFDAGVIPGMKLVAVNSQGFTADVLDAAIVDAAKSHQPIDWLVDNTGTYSTLSVSYYGGQQYPHLVRADGEPDRIADIIKARSLPDQ